MEVTGLTNILQKIFRDCIWGKLQFSPVQTVLDNAVLEDSVPDLIQSCRFSLRSNLVLVDSVPINSVLDPIQSWTIQFYTQLSLR